jgi:hypothetical protein
MKTGANQDVKNFVNGHSMNGQSFDCESEYYNLHNYDLDYYDRKFAVVDSRYDNNKLKNSPGFNEDFFKRCELLHSQGFAFILNTAWESKENIKQLEIYPHIPFEHFVWTGGTSWFWVYMYNKHQNHTFNFNHDHLEKKYDFLYLNKQGREHRLKLSKKLIDNDVLSNSLYTNWPDIKLPLSYELPWAQNYPEYGKDQDIYEKPYNDTKYNLVSETNDTNDEVFMTEKIWKPIIAQQVFVVHGNYLYLQKLREIGFKTFGNYFDESYDLEKDGDKRRDKIVNTCRDLLSRNWQDIYLQTQSLRQHNYDTFFNKEKLSVEINKTLDLFLEFADSR